MLGVVNILIWPVVGCLSLQACASGPHLGKPQRILVTQIGVDSEKDVPLCGNFKLNSAQAGKFLNNAVIITPFELHDYYDIAPCFVRGTAIFRGSSANWEIRAGGTATVTFFGEFSYLLADEAQRNDPE